MSLLSAEQLIYLSQNRKSDQEFHDFEETIDKLMLLGFGSTDNQVIHNVEILLRKKVRIVNRWKTDKRSFKKIFENKWLFGDLGYEK